MEWIEAGGARLEVHRIDGDAADSAPLVFLHEGLGSVAMWRDWPESLCRETGRAGFVYSRRGYGQSESIPDVRGTGRLAPDYMHREAIEVLPVLLDRWGVHRPVLVGHSDGATIALIHASHFPVHACIAMAPHVIVEDVSIRSIEAAREAFEKGDLRERLKRYHRDVDCAFWQWNDIWLSPAFRSFDIRADCRRIAAPVLAIQGEDDPYGTLDQVRGIEPTLGLFATEILAPCGHSPHRDQPRRTNEAITKFLAALA
ncbi:MAG TPA: alpha/beta hydrolase [Candidatus Paceibacterota bacterium]|nr:alpha/beta hydrolase [Candidatus Paceibacterota bacterium]